MKMYIVYDKNGDEMVDRKGETVMVTATGLNQAEEKAKKKYGEDKVGMVIYTEI